MYTKSITHHIAKITIDILFYLSIILTALSPFFTDDMFYLIGFKNMGLHRMAAVTGIIFVSGIACIFILYSLKCMYRTLLVGNPFIDSNVSHLRRIALICGLAALVYIVKCIFMFTIATLVITVIFTVGCLFCLTLKDLFKQAINYKSENELTI